ncbi:MAG: ABC transporter ATP-binding protein [Deltaproteobacteria bacterium]|nr:MAG: ABC transporter ATP-binding protein [Deltaproteobacteria bacterium]
MSFSTVSIERVTRVYGRTRALAGVDLRLQSGTVTALLGPNGAGKSTLLHILSTLMLPSSGRIRYGEVDHGRAAETLRGEIGLVSHATLVYPPLSALENLDFFGRLYGVRGRKERARTLLRQVGLAESAWTRPAATYSRGMLQRLALARALLPDPRLLLLDEPFTGLDRDASVRLMEILRDVRGQGRIVLLVTHDLEGAAQLADRVAILSRGRIAEILDGPLDGAALAEAYLEHTAAVSAESTR